MALIVRTNYAKSNVAVDGAATGIIGVASAVGFVKGARVTVANATGGIIAIIVGISGNNLTLRNADIKGSYGPSTMVGWTVAGSAYVVQDADQLVEVFHPEDVPAAYAIPVRVAP